MKHSVLNRPQQMLLRIIFLTVSFAIISITAACTSAGADDASIAFTESNVEAARDDLSKIYDSECYGSFEASSFSDCTFENPDSEFSVYLIGDSHSVQWTPALVKIADEFNWKLTIIGKRTCPFSLAKPAFKGKEYLSCEQWNREVLARLATEHPDAVITSNYSRSKMMGDVEVLPVEAGTAGEAALAESMVEAWNDVLDLRVPLVVIRDIPYLGFNTPDCLLEHLTSPDDCKAPRSEAVNGQPHPDLIAAEELDLPVLDLTDQICRTVSTCYSTEKQSIVFRDKHHLTAAYAAQLSQPLEVKLRKVPVVASHM